MAERNRHAGRARTRRAWLAATGVLAATTAASAFAGGSSHAVTCGGGMAILVWPHGHPVIRSVNFPSITNPHVEVYSGFDRKYPEPAYVGYVLGGKPTGQIPIGDVSIPCAETGTSAPATATVPDGVTYRTQTGLRCKIHGSGVMDLIDRGHGVRVLILHSGKKILLRADATPKTASVTVPKGACAPQPAPK
jgi:hypothetical protein